MSDHQSADDAMQLRKASEDALSFALHRAGWTEEQIISGLRGHRDAFAHELAERIREAGRAVSFSDAYYVGTGMRDAANLIDPGVA
ncbi:hypothetical protein OHA79_09445 [Streptomyces sp. NBC_00841]|uniref:hypothetical protein n=1 Tax=Streptomyces sp. NBC_00841 TaxID=2975847 RepID=UPI002DDB0C93|nr:hypothetical protein [Streptomyces sp. NBC_00841]WRZ98038.1 hypothetical protein OHA79_09445 [Streptomyces sp. NBC_00841]